MDILFRKSAEVHLQVSDQYEESKSLSKEVNSKVTNGIEKWVSGMGARLFHIWHISIIIDAVQQFSLTLHLKIQSPK